MADNDLFDGMEDFKGLGDEDFQDLLGDANSELGDFSSEFDGLMDLEDFEKLGSSDSMGGLDGLLDMDFNSGTSGLEEDDDLSLDLEMNITNENASTNASKQKQSISDSTKKNSNQPKETASKKPSMESSAEEFLDLDDELIIEGEESKKDNVQNVLDTGAKTNADFIGVDEANDELLLDMPDLDEKKALKNVKEKDSGGKANGIFQKIFGNVPDENAEKNAAKEAERQAAKEAKKAAKKTKEEIALEKQEKQKAKEEAAAIKKAEQEAKKAKKEEAKK